LYFSIFFDIPSLDFFGFFLPIMKIELSGHS
jgi:hypothetical protein